ncbi:MAG TPA: ribosome-associated translation inhibitor RaiA [Gemmatimonadota bacterium]|jgi:putative sigma-54 modulation protein
MRLRIAARHLDVPAGVRDQVRHEIEKLTRIYEPILAADVAIAGARGRHTVDVRLHVNGADCAAVGTGDGIRAAAEDAVEKLRRQLVRHKAKLRRRALRPKEALLRGKAVEVTGVVPEVPPLPDTGERPRRRAARSPRRPGTRRSGP